MKLHDLVIYFCTGNICRYKGYLLIPEWRSVGCVAIEDTLYQLVNIRVTRRQLDFWNYAFTCSFWCPKVPDMDPHIRLADVAYGDMVYTFTSTRSLEENLKTFYEDVIKK